MLPKEDIIQLNESISNIQQLCLSMLYCRDCPMKDNCFNMPEKWTLINPKEDNE